jgi:hypothetical protein
MENESIELSKVLSKTITNAVKYMMHKAKYDKTIEGRYIEKLSDNNLKVMINNTVYTVKSEYGLAYNLKLYDVVKVHIPQNDYTKMYTL